MRNSTSKQLSWACAQFVRKSWITMNVHFAHWTKCWLYKKSKSLNEPAVEFIISNEPTVGFRFPHDSGTNEGLTRHLSS